MMPLEWRNQFEKSNQHLNTTTLPALMEYMTTLSSLEDNTFKKRKSNNSGNESTSSSKQVRFDNRYSRGGRGNRGRGLRGGFNGGRGRGGHGGRSNRPQPDDNCPVHGSHQWKMCYLNPYGENYRPSTGGRNSNPGRGRGNGGRNGNNPNFYNDNGSVDSRQDRSQSGSGRFAGGRFAQHNYIGGQVGPTSSTQQSWYAQGDSPHFINDNLSQLSDRRW
jgi:hypothetical protein